MKLLYTKFQLKCSIGLGVIFSFVHIGGVFCVYFIQLGGFVVKAALIFCSLVNLVVVMRNYILLNSAAAVVEFGVGVDGEKVIWLLQKHAGDSIEAIINYPLFVSNYLIIINFMPKGQRSKIVVLISRDALNAEDFRKLKMVLKMAR